MEAFGRTIAVMLSVVFLFFSFTFIQMVSVQWQKNEAIRSIGNAFVDTILKDGVVSQQRLEGLCTELEAFGTYQVEFVVYERRRFEGEKGRIYLFQKWMVKSDDVEKEIANGSYVRLKIMEREKGKIETFLYGESGIYIGGGRVS